MKNLTTTLEDAISRFGLPDVLANLAFRVRRMKDKTLVTLAACKLADIAYALEQASYQATASDMVIAFESLYDKPKMRVVVYDFTRDKSREYKFTVAIRTPEDAPNAETLRETQELDRAHVDLKLTQLRTRYDVVEVVELEWFPAGNFQPVD
jgi:spore cortex formation protein SpoVR/YcgB (stage V sporulation)